MTIAIILLVAFLVGCVIQALVEVVGKHNYRKQTITDVELQDKLSIKNFKKIVDDIIAMPDSDKLSGEALLNAIESLYEVYNVPDRRTPTQKVKDHADFKSKIQRLISFKEYPADDTTLPLMNRIWHYPHQVPDMNHLELLYGIPNTTIEHNGGIYEYDSRGIACLYWTIPSKLIGDLEVLLTTRDLAEAGYKFSGDRRGSHWQHATAEAKKYQENKEKYPWLYD